MYHSFLIHSSADRHLGCFQEKAMAPHSSTLAWNIPWTAEPAAIHGVAKSQTQLSNFTFTFHFHALEKEMEPTPVLLPGESQGWLSLVGCCLWGRTESDTTEVTEVAVLHCVYVPQLSYPFIC